MKGKANYTDLRVYQEAERGEDLVYALLIKHDLSDTPAEFADLLTDLRRASFAVGHHIKNMHERYSFGLKIEELHEARRASEDCVGYLIRYSDKYPITKKETEKLVDLYCQIIKQCWGLIKWLRVKKEKNGGKNIEISA